MIPSLAPSIRDALSALRFDLPVRSSVPEIETLLNQSVLWGGKRLRPLLVFLSADFCGVDLKRAASYARSAEMTHAATLAHDDVIDEARERRRRKTLNARASNSRAVLAGDYLLAKAVREICGRGNPELVDRLAEVLEELVSGEWLQLEARGILDVNFEHLESVGRKKTASLISWCCTIGPTLKGAEISVIQRFHELGEHLGIAFQLVDDTLDFVENPEKPFAQDLREGLINAVSLTLLELYPSKREGFRKLLKVAPDLEYPQFPQFPQFPWTEEELARAVQGVRQRAWARIRAAETILESLARDLGVSSEDPAYRAFLEILKLIPERKR